MNVLLITADQWRGECLGALQHPCLRTPCLDRLAADGVLFARHFSQATPCGPGRASLHTGMYQHNHRVVANGTPLAARHTNVALEARKAGLEPVLFGYTDVTADPRCRDPADPALHRIDDTLPGMTPVVRMDDEMYPWIADLLTKGYTIPEGELGVFTPPLGNSARGGTYNPALFSAEDSATAFLTNAAMQYVSVRGRKPWFVHLSFLSPHPPFVVPAPYHDMYDPESVPRPVRASSATEEMQQHPYLAAYLPNQEGSSIFVGHDSKQNLHLSDTEILQARATYYGMMSEVDAQIGRMMDFLVAERMYEDTLIVFTSDHGEQLGDHWQFAKYGYFDASFSIPLIIRAPGQSRESTRGQIIDSFTGNIDIMPTILEVLGLPRPVQCDGRSLDGFLCQGTSDAWPEHVFWEFDFRHLSDVEGRRPLLGIEREKCGVCVMRGRRFKYVYFSSLPALLFDLENDPNELQNLAEDPNYQTVVNQHMQAMMTWRMQTEDRTLTQFEVTADGLVCHRA